jgi:Asp-tRNA(Asn)/Glu-tRNA(Gln) amidotransferase B subunit
MHITVQTRDDVANDLVKDKPRLAETKRLRTALEKLGLNLEPMHPGTDDADLATYFSIAVPEGHDPEDVAKRLRASKAVKAAYVKPRGEPPRV